MMRNDHDAALARVKALEQELEREKADDQQRNERLAKLEAELTAARKLLDGAQTELAQLRPEPTPPPAATAPAPAPQVSSPAPSGSRSLAMTIALLALGFGVLVLLVARSSEKSGSVSRRAKRPPPTDVLPDDISMFLEEGRARGQELLPGSRIIEMTVKGVDRHGRLHPQYGLFSVDVFRNDPPPERSVEPERPIGAPRPAEPAPAYSCFTLERDSTAWRENILARSDLVHLCMFGELRAKEDEISPVCTTKSIWQRALADGAPPGAIAEIRFDGSWWRFVIDDDRAPFRKDYDDGCIHRRRN